MEKPSFTNGYALLIGVGADLPITIKDARALYDLFVHPTQAAYPPHQVTLLTELEACRENILHAFDQLIAQVDKNQEATVIVYFSGHGIKVETPGKLPDYFLVPYGYDPNQWETTTISGQEFTAKIEAIKARKLVVLLDCCHAGGIPTLKGPGGGPVKSAPFPIDVLTLLDKGSGRVIVASSTENEASFTGHPYSIFTTCLIEALAGKEAIHKDGFAHVLDVLIYLLRYVPQRTSDRQHPFVNKVLNLSDNFPLCYYAGGSKEIPGELPVPLPAAVSSGRRARLEQKRDMLQADRNLLIEKIRRMRKALIVEYNIAITFQIGQQLQQEEKFLIEIERELDEIESII